MAPFTGGVAVVNAHVVEPVSIDCRDRLGDAVEKRVRTDEARSRVGLRLCGQMLGAAEADLQPQD